jgi:hypothetical protein
MTWTRAAIDSTSNWDVYEETRESIRLRWSWTIFALSHLRSRDVSWAMRQVELARLSKGMGVVSVDGWGNS